MRLHDNVEPRLHDDDEPHDFEPSAVPIIAGAASTDRTTGPRGLRSLPTVTLRRACALTALLACVVAWLMWRTVLCVDLTYSLLARKQRPLELTPGASVINLRFVINQLVDDFKRDLDAHVDLDVERPSEDVIGEDHKFA